jgi:hypothetical protein
MIGRLPLAWIVALVLFAACSACGGTGAATADEDATGRTGRAPAAWLLSREDGSVVHQAAENSHEVLEPWGRREPADFANPGIELQAPVIDYDPVAQVLWYSDSHESIRSIRIADGEPGPTFSSFSDTAIQGCGVSTNGRLFAVDPTRRLLYAPMLTGQVLAYDLDTKDVRAYMPMSAFNDLILGRYRTLAIDPGAMMWALDEHGVAHEYDPERAVATGRIVDAHATDLAIDVGRGVLLLREEDGVRAVALDTLAEVAVAVPGGDDVTQAVPVAVEVVAAGR